MKKSISAPLLALFLSAFSWSNAGATMSTMSDIEMTNVLGGGAGPCRNCHYAGARFDECAHYTSSEPTPCYGDKCIADYHISSTCDLGTPADCATEMSPDMPGVVQYLRADTDCQAATQYYHNWLTDYFGNECDCDSVTWRVNCDKTNGSCDGTLIDTANRGTQILCAN